MSTPVKRKAAPAFRPTISLGFAYLAAFFLLFALALALPALWPLLGSTAPGPELQELARETARATLRPRIGLAFALAVLATLAGTWLRVLPGMPKDTP
ncbi:MAG: hypothetical protein IT386_15280 [Deltaproteobacteria bacterium]|nr:hypothetical protein [Deltaproteobacteria bacterium]